MIIYETFIRTHSQSGSFLALEKDLERIRHLGVDTLLLMPIFPIGRLNRKGTLGSPYSVLDHKAVNPEFGGISDLIRLIESAHRIGLRIILDVVCHHCAQDSLLVTDHPDWFNVDSSGHVIIPQTGWTDIVEFRFPNPALIGYFVETLKGWAHFGFDGFRCDCASLVPLEFWGELRQRVDSASSDLIWIAESVTPSAVIDLRKSGRHVTTDCELCSVFDSVYDYNLWPAFNAAIRNQIPVQQYLELVCLEDTWLPRRCAKLRFVENHDTMRILSILPQRSQILAWTAFQAFNRGDFLIYGGLESGALSVPSLFNQDGIDWARYDLAHFFRDLFRIKQTVSGQGSHFQILTAAPAICAVWLLDEGGLLGIFNVRGESGEMSIPLSDGSYQNLIGGQNLLVRGGAVSLPPDAQVFYFERAQSLPEFSSNLMASEFAS